MSTGGGRGGGGVLSRRRTRRTRAAAGSTGRATWSRRRPSCGAPRGRSPLGTALPGRPWQPRG
eukprot:4883689-Prymnesium_polylepis.1